MCVCGGGGFRGGGVLKSRAEAVRKGEKKMRERKRKRSEASEGGRGRNKVLKSRAEAARKGEKMRERKRKR